MHLKFPYNHTANKEEAFNVVLKQFDSEEFKALNIPVEIEQNTNEITASGKGFKVIALFHETELNLTLELSIYLKPFMNKIEGKLSSIISHCI